MALMTAQEYVESLRKLNTRVYMFGEKIENWVDHPMIRPSINCVAMTYALAQDPQYADLMTVKSSLTGHTGRDHRAICKRRSVPQYRRKRTWSCDCPEFYGTAGR